MTQHFLVYFNAGTDEVVAIYTNNEGKTITRQVLDSHEADLDVQEFSIETPAYIAPSRMFQHVISTNRGVSFRPEMGVGNSPIAKTLKKTIPRRGPSA